ncbi:hypothetical protein MPSEU_000382700 [Mayamaea pseudoterrestris]|nr:hypothetical protein MPSEU_000382700 [Mayamaea pseudoterrestris]
MIVTPFKSFAVLAAMFVAPAASQGTNATTLACGDTGKAYFRSTNELRAAVSCITTFQNCNSTDLPESSRTTLSDLGVLGAVLETGSLDAVLDGRDVDAQVLTNALGGDVWKELQVNSIIDQLFKDLEALVIALLDLLINLLEGLRGSFGPLSTWCVGSLTNLDNVFAGLKDFNAPLDWDVSNVTSFVGTFKDATAFNQVCRMESGLFQS